MILFHHQSHRSLHSEADVLWDAEGGHQMINNKRIMKDLVVILPGITGSVLVKGNIPIWAPAPRMFVSYIMSLGKSIEDLLLKNDDPEYDDGVRATGLVPYTIVPGLARFDGYTGLTKKLFEEFKFEKGNAIAPDAAPANYFEFPYDWRRSNRHSAKRLEELIKRELAKWRNHTHNPSAKAILIGHSMGGLIARYYIEKLNGFPNVRALITFGTPHRGAVDIIEYLANGYRKFGHKLNDLTAAMRSFPSVYQLLPRYDALWDDTDRRWKKVFETIKGIDHLDRKMATDGYDFFIEIEKAYEENKRSDEYNVDLLPIMGWGHETLQSAIMSVSRQVTTGTTLPPVVDPVAFPNGDGSVPRVSAVPIEFNNKPSLWWPVNQKHAILQNTNDLVKNLVQTLAAWQGDLSKPARAVGTQLTDKGVGLKIDEVFLPDEPVSFTVTTNVDGDPGCVSAKITNYDAGFRKVVELKAEGNAWIGKVTGLETGTYRVEVWLHNKELGPKDPVADIFEVI